MVQVAAACGAVLDPEPVPVWWPAVVVEVLGAGGKVEPDVADFPGWVGGSRLGVGGGGIWRRRRRRCFWSEGDFGLDRGSSSCVEGGSCFGVEGDLAGHDGLED